MAKRILVAICLLWGLAAWPAAAQDLNATRTLKPPQVWLVDLGADSCFTLRALNLHPAASFFVYQVFQNDHQVFQEDVKVTRGELRQGQCQKAPSRLMILMREGLVEFNVTKP